MSAPTRRVIHGVPVDERRAYVEELLEKATRTRRDTRLVCATFSTVRGHKPRTVTVEALGVALSAVHGSDELVVRSGEQLWTIPLSVLRHIDGNVCPSCGRPDFTGTCGCGFKAAS